MSVKDVTVLTPTTAHLLLVIHGKLKLLLNQSINQSHLLWRQLPVITGAVQVT